MNGISGLSTDLILEIFCKLKYTSFSIFLINKKFNILYISNKDYILKKFLNAYLIKFINLEKPYLNVKRYLINNKGFYSTVTDKKNCVTGKLLICRSGQVNFICDDPDCSKPVFDLRFFFWYVPVKYSRN